MENLIERFQLIGLSRSNKNKLKPIQLFQFHLVFSGKTGISKDKLGTMLKSKGDLAPGILCLSFFIGAVFMLEACWMV